MTFFICCPCRLSSSSCSHIQALDEVRDAAFIPLCSRQLSLIYKDLASAFMLIANDKLFNFHPSPQLPRPPGN